MGHISSMLGRQDESTENHDFMDALASAPRQHKSYIAKMVSNTEDAFHLMPQACRYYTTRAKDEEQAASKLLDKKPLTNAQTKQLKEVEDRLFQETKSKLREVVADPECGGMRQAMRHLIGRDYQLVVRCLNELKLPNKVVYIGDNEISDGRIKAYENSRFRPIYIRYNTPRTSRMGPNAGTKFIRSIKFGKDNKVDSILSAKVFDSARNKVKKNDLHKESKAERKKRKEDERTKGIARRVDDMKLNLDAKELEDEQIELDATLAYNTQYKNEIRRHRRGTLIKEMTDEDKVKLQAFIDIVDPGNLYPRIDTESTL